MPQRIRVTTWKAAHGNYTKSVKPDRVGIISENMKPLVQQWFQPSQKRFREGVYSERRKPLKNKDFRRFSMSVCRLFVA